MPKERPADALAMKLGPHSHHVDLGGVPAMPHQREQPHVPLSECGDDGKRPIGGGDVVLH
jgi:hypothetical protein